MNKSDIIEKIKKLLEINRSNGATEAEEIESLRELLKECYPYVNKEFERQTMAENYHKNKFVKPLELLNKLDASIGESEE